MRVVGGDTMQVIKEPLGVDGSLRHVVTVFSPFEAFEAVVVTRNCVKTVDCRNSITEQDDGNDEEDEGCPVVGR